MKFNYKWMAKKAIFIALLILSLIFLSLLIFAIIYANPESVYKKWAFMIGIGFIAVSRTALLYNKKNINAE